MRVFCAWAVTLLLACSVCAQRKTAPIRLDSGSRQMLASPDKTFALDALQSTLAGEQFGKLAASKATSADLKNLGNRMAEQQTKWNGQLKELLASEHMTAAGIMTAKNQTAYDSLKRLSGEAFDKAFVEHVQKEQETVMKAFEREGKNGKDPKLQNFASDALPVLREQLDTLHTLRSQFRSS